MPFPLNDIKSMISVIPYELEITSVRTKKICIQDILSRSNINIVSLVPQYEIPKLFDLIKQGMIAVTRASLNEQIKEQENKDKNAEQLSTLKKLLQEKLLENYGSNAPVPTIDFTPVEMNVPLGGGQMDFNPFQANDILSTLIALSKDLKTMFLSLRTTISQYFTAIHKELELNRSVDTQANEYVVDAISLLLKAMSKSIADYFRSMVINVIKNGCAYFPVGLAGKLKVRVINNTPMPQAIAFTDVVVKSMNYELSKPSPFTVLAGPMENDIISIPVLVENVDAVEYILNHKGKGVIPITLISDVRLGPLSQKLEFSEGNVEVT